MVRCEVTGRSRGSSRDHTSLAAVPLRTLSRVFGRVREPRVDVFSRVGGGGRGVEEGWYAGNVFLGSHGATPLPWPLVSLTPVALCRPYSHSCARARVLRPTHDAHTYITSMARGDRWSCVASERARGVPPPKNCSSRGTVGRAATPLDRP